MRSSSSLLNQSLLKDLVWATLVNTSILTLILLYGNLQKHDELLVQTIGLNFGSVIEIVVLLIPYALSMGLPFGFALALLFCIGRWASDREILALRTLGMNIWQLSWPIILLSVLLSLLATYASLQWSPVNRAKFEQRKKEIVLSNLKMLLEKDEQITFPLNTDEDKSQFSGFANLDQDNLSSISISVSEIQVGDWKNLRMVITSTTGEIMAILHARSANVSNNEDLSKLIFSLRDVDVEPGFQDEQKEDEFNRFITFEKWKQPIVLNLSEKNSIHSINHKKLGFFQKLHFINTSQDKKNLHEVKFAFSKELALGFSPFFLGILLIPLAAKQGKKETMINIALGVIACLLYHALGSIFESALREFPVGYFSWWFPNILFFVTGVLLFKSFE
jgi:lipopolysaccharide export LptBFGC system permease protein LptF